MRTIAFRAAAGIGLAAALVACGQKGPLVLPDAQHPHKKLVVPKPATPSAPPSAAAPAGASPASPSSSPSGNDDPGSPKSNPAPPQ